MRSKSISRQTAETKIELDFAIDGSGETNISTGVGFFDHMLTLFTKHGRFDLTVNCDGDTEVDQHHSVEDIGIVLGQAFYDSIGTKEGIGAIMPRFQHLWTKHYLRFRLILADAHFLSTTLRV